MSVQDDLIAAGIELEKARARLSIAGGVMAAAMVVAKMMRNDEAQVWYVVAAKRMIKLTNHFSAGILAGADQLNEELKRINGK